MGSVERFHALTYSRNPKFPKIRPCFMSSHSPDASRRCAFQAVVSLAEVARVSRLIMKNCFSQARYLSRLDECYGDFARLQNPSWRLRQEMNRMSSVPSRFIKSKEWRSQSVSSRKVHHMTDALSRSSGYTLLHSDGRRAETHERTQSG